MAARTCCKRRNIVEKASSEASGKEQGEKVFVLYRLFCSVPGIMFAEGPIVRFELSPPGSFVLRQIFLSSNFLPRKGRQVRPSRRTMVPVRTGIR